MPWWVPLRKPPGCYPCNCVLMRTLLIALLVVLGSQAVAQSLQPAIDSLRNLAQSNAAPDSVVVNAYTQLIDQNAEREATVQRMLEAWQIPESHLKFLEKLAGSTQWPHLDCKALRKRSRARARRRSKAFSLQFKTWAASR